MRTFKCVFLLLLTAGLASATPAGNLVPRHIPTKPDQALIQPCYDRLHLEVKFLDDSDIGLNDLGRPYDRSSLALRSGKAVSVINSISDAGATWMRMSHVAEERMDALVANAEQNLRREISDINNYFIITVPAGIETEEWIDALNSLPDVEIAKAMPLPMPAPVVPGAFQNAQGYLRIAPDGIGADSAWLLPGGNGWPPSANPVRICDFEYSWHLTHNDFPSVNYVFSPSTTPSDPFSDNNHGTAVIGELASLSNGIGTTGIVYAAQIWAAPTYLDAAWQLGAAMTWVMSAFGPGDVFLIEQLIGGPHYRITVSAMADIGRSCRGTTRESLL